MIQGFSGGLLNRELIYNLDLPSFQRDFASLKTLDHGTGPAITFTRASDATFFDANGVLQTAANGVARFDHSQDGAANSLGLLIEEARTNSLPNAQAVGSVVGTPGTLPTSWAHVPGGLVANIIGHGTEDGMTFIDIQFVGTATSSSSGLRFVGTTSIVGASPQTWTLTMSARTVSGSTAGLTQLVLNIFGRTAGNAATSDSDASSDITGTLGASSLRSNRLSHTSTLADATTARVNGQLLFGHTAGTAIDLTLRIAAPQLELGAFPTSYIPTTTAEATRSADSAVVTPIASFYNQAEGTLFAEFASTAPGNRVAVSIDDASNNNRVQLGAGSGNVNQPITGIAAQGNIQFFLTYANVSSQPFRIIMALRANDSQTAVNSTAQTAVTSLTMPSPNRMVIGRDRVDAAHMNGHIRKIAYFPKRLTNTLLEQLTT